MPAAALRDVDNDVGVPKTDDFGAQDYRKILELKSDHASRPLWIVCYSFGMFLVCLAVRYRLRSERRFKTIYKKSQLKNFKKERQTGDKLKKTKHFF